MTFHGELQRLMTDRGIGVRALARAVHYDAGHVSKVTRGVTQPSIELARAIDDHLGAEGALIAAKRLAQVHPDPGACLNPDDEERLAMAARKPARIDAGVVDALAMVLDGQRRLEDVIGSAPLVEPVRAQLATIKRLVIDARGPLRPRVVDVAAQWAQFSGWLNISVGKLGSARGWYDRAGEWAAEADNHNLSANIMSFRGHIAWLSGHPGPTVGLSQAAQRMRGVFPGQLTYDALQEARGHAMVGEVSEAETALGRASDMIERMTVWRDDIPPWSYYYSTPLYAMERGLVYRLLGRMHPAFTQRAVDVLTTAISDFPEDMRASEWAGEFVYQLGRAHLQAGEQDQAAVLADELDEMATQLSSARLAGHATALR
jgi:hypothetical protein